MLLTVVKQLGDQVEQDHYLQQISQASGIGIDALRDKLSASSNDPVRLKQVKDQPKPIDGVGTKDWQKASDALLCLALMLPSIRAYLGVLSIDMMPSQDSKKVLEFLKSNPAFDGDMKSAKPLKETINYAKVLSLQFEELYGDVDTLELQFEAARQRAKILSHFVKQSKKTLSEELKNASGKKEQALLKRSAELDKLLNSAKDI